VENIVDHLISYQQQFRILHWQTKSYARHKAYGDFYDSFSDLMDEFIETHMGKYGRVKTGGKIEISNMNDVQIKDYLEEIEQFLIELSEEYDERKDSDLLNIRDEMLASVNKLKYLLTLD
jgi:Family of unknown function (DUF5856)